MADYGDSLTCLVSLKLVDILLLGTARGEAPSALQAMAALMPTSPLQGSTSPHLPTHHSWEEEGGPTDAKGSSSLKQVTKTVGWIW